MELSGNDHAVALPLKSYLAVIEIFMRSLKSNNNFKFKLRAIRFVLTGGRTN